MRHNGWLLDTQIMTNDDTNTLPDLPNSFEASRLRVLIIDHYDSFTQTIKSYFEVLGASVKVVQYDAPKLEEYLNFSPTHIVLSPGPGAPSAAQPTQKFIQKYYQHYPMLGICLGHQCIVEAFGGQVIPAAHIFHGKTSEITHTGTGIFNHLPAQFNATRYHSLVADKAHLPPALKICAWTTSQQTIMGVEHEKYPIFGVQYHPEAILTEVGHAFFINFLRY